ncbi:MAG: glycosyltransferase [Lachnospiraceae bacterium]|jgi:glycosyltransferase involved in cell wall biosynthesis|nr:glycosyltransferase [Lachnospiraceae bacterium]
MKTVSVVVPCYNEEENVEAIALAIKETFRRDLPDYRYEIIFIDNDSSDQTRAIIRRLCGEDKDIKGIFNAKNFGQFNSPYYAMLQSTGDCTVLMAADFQDPVEMIPKYVLEWEYGYKIVIGIKSSSRENRLMYWLRGCYYKMIKKFSDVEQIEQFTGFGLYDAEFIQVLRDLNDPTPFLRGIVAELGFRRKEIPYEQPRRRAGKTSNNFYRLYDAAMLSITSYTKAGLRLATVFGSICSAVSILVALIYLVMKLLYWDRFAAGMAPLLIGMCFLGSVQIFFIGMVGEYILSMNQRIMKRPLVVEEERLNFGNSHSRRKKNQGKQDPSDRKLEKGESGQNKRKAEGQNEGAETAGQKGTKQNELQEKAARQIEIQQKEVLQKGTEAMKEKGSYTKPRRRRKKPENGKPESPKTEGQKTGKPNGQNAAG